MINPLRKLIEIMNRKTLSKALSALTIKEGDCVLVQCESIEKSHELAQAIAKMRNEVKLNKCLIIVMDKGDTIRRLDEEQMRRMGWQRIQA